MNENHNTSKSQKMDSMTLRSHCKWGILSPSEQDHLRRSYDINQHFPQLLAMNLSVTEKLGLISALINRNLSESQIAQLKNMILGCD